MVEYSTHYNLFKKELINKLSVVKNGDSEKSSKENLGNKVDEVLDNELNFQITKKFKSITIKFIFCSFAIFNILTFSLVICAFIIDLKYIEINLAGYERFVTPAVLIALISATIAQTAAAFILLAKYIFNMFDKPKTDDKKSSSPLPVK